MRALVFLLLFAVAAAAVVFSVLEFYKRNTPEAKRAQSIADLSRRAAAAAEEGRLAEAERLDYAAERLIDGMHTGRPKSGFPLDDYPQHIIDRHRSKTLDESEQQIADELRRRVGDLMRDRERPDIPEHLRRRADAARTDAAPGDRIPEHLRKRADEARRRAQPRGD